MESFVDDEKNVIKYNIDQFEDGGHFVWLNGWIFSENSDIDLVRFVAVEGEKEFALDMKWKKRTDVAKSFHRENVYCGFAGNFLFIRQLAMSVFLEYQIGAKCGRILLCELEPNATTGDVVLENNGDFSYTEFKNSCVVEKVPIAEAIYNTTIDLIVPVYNGYEYLENVFAGIEKTKVPYHLFIVDDCSSDERVLPFLKSYAESRENVELLRNRENLGFVATVNKALERSKNHVAIINTDVILPEGWLERLMSPILADERVASTTPYSNSATICSFPNFGEDNEIYLGMTVDEIDAYFARIKPRYVEMPTGIGFCMGMNHKAIQEVGVFDAETFDQGYGEENDWCQRAIQKGFRNVQVENLFVWHKHGGSFASEDKQRYINQHMQIINERYPNYNEDVAQFVAHDPNKSVRDFVQYAILKNRVEDFVFIVSHNWGGGANSYLDGKIKEILDSGKGVIKFINDDLEKDLVLVLQYREQKVEIVATDFDEVRDILSGIQCSEILLNEMVSFTDIKELQEFLLLRKDEWNAKMTMLCHDFFAVCPSICLINDENRHCFLPENKEQCRRCYQNNFNKINSEYGSIDKWREIWGNFLEKCDEVVCFSENTKDYFKKCYPEVRYTITPHQVDYIEPVGEYDKTEKIVSIGILGNLTYLKGLGIVRRMAKIIEERSLNARIVIIGPNIYGEEDIDNVMIHGKYQREELPELLRRYEIDMVFISSIWPETFSYTTEEAIKMGVPVASFDLGAQADRIRKYEKGLIISKISARVALREIMQYVIEKGGKEIPFVKEQTQDTSSKGKREAVLKEWGVHVFDWYPFAIGKTCLIVGEGTVFIQDSVAQQLEQVSAIEEIAEIDENKQYDYIILYGIKLSSEITIAKTALAEHGKIFLMTDNRIGLRYLTGEADAHTGRYFSGINQYEDAEVPDRGFTKKELIDLMADAGVSGYKFYYLYPNEKTLKEVFTDESIEAYEYGRPYCNFNYGTAELFSEQRMAETLQKEQVIAEFANYFVVEISDTNAFAPISYAKIDGLREPELPILNRELVDLQKWYLSNGNASEAKLYFDYGDGFFEENKVIAMLMTSDDGYFEVKYRIPEGVIGVMWKPVEVRNLKGCAIEVVGGTIEKISGITEDGKTDFRDGDAQYYIKLDENVKQLVIRGTIQMADMVTSALNYKNELQELHAEYKEMTARYEDVTARYEAILNSRSWKILQNLRRILRK